MIETKSHTVSFLWTCSSKEQALFVREKRMSRRGKKYKSISKREF